LHSTQLLIQAMSQFAPSSQAMLDNLHHAAVPPDTMLAAPLAHAHA
jgi:hypothetical protein